VVAAAGQEVPPAGGLPRIPAPAAAVIPRPARQNDAARD
jgi:hypothetical protein